MMEFWDVVFAFRNEIEMKRMAGGSWNWEHTVPRENLKGIDPATLCRAIGCWERGNDPDNYRFYTSQNHPIWRSR